MKAKQKEEDNFEMEKEDLLELQGIKQIQEEKDIKEEEEDLDFDPLLEENDIYDEEGAETLFDDDSISDDELGFMVGYLAS
jgi:hypothetical protein